MIFGEINHNSFVQVNHNCGAFVYPIWPIFPKIICDLICNDSDIPDLRSKEVRNNAKSWPSQFLFRGIPGKPSDVWIPKHTFIAPTCTDKPVSMNWFLSRFFSIPRKEV